MKVVLRQRPCSDCSIARKTLQPFDCCWPTSTGRAATDRKSSIRSHKSATSAWLTHWPRNTLRSRIAKKRPPSTRCSYSSRPQFRKLAGKALARHRQLLVSAAVNGLQNDGSPQAVKLLVTASKPLTTPQFGRTSPRRWEISELASPKVALNKAADSDNVAKRQKAIEALHAISQRSPGYPYFMQGRQSAQGERWDEAITRYSSALEIDPELAEAYSGRGHAIPKEEHRRSPPETLPKRSELQEIVGAEAVTGLGICLVQEGNLDGGIQLIEKPRDSMNEDYIYTYNAACVYGRVSRTRAQAATHAGTRSTGRSISRKIDRRFASFRQAWFSGARMDEKGFRPGVAARYAGIRKIVSQDASSDENRSPQQFEQRCGPGKATPRKEGTNALRGGAPTSIRSDPICCSKAQNRNLGTHSPPADPPWSISTESTRRAATRGKRPWATAAASPRRTLASSRTAVSTSSTRSSTWRSPRASPGQSPPD